MTVVGSSGKVLVSLFNTGIVTSFGLIVLALSSLAPGPGVTTL